MAIRMVLTDTETGALDGKVEEWIEAKIAAALAAHTPTFTDNGDGTMTIGG